MLAQEKSRVPAVTGSLVPRKLRRTPTKRPDGGAGLPSSSPTPDPDAYDDQALIIRAREGDRGAVADLYRRHRDTATRAAARICGPSEVEDVVSDAFVRVFNQIEHGGGPQVSFRAYLMSAVRSAHVDLVRRDARHVWTDQLDDRMPNAPTTTDAGSAEHSESDALVQALATLPERWQLVLWWNSVEGRSQGEIGAALGMKANAVAALAFRAREGLRDAYLAAHVDSSRDELCAPWRKQLPAYVRDRLTDHALRKVLDHLTTCTPCASTADELRALLVALVR